MVVIRNNVAAAVLMDTTGQPNIPAYSMAQAPGDNLGRVCRCQPDHRHDQF